MRDPDPTFGEELYRKWCSWLDRIDDDITGLWLNRDVWRTVVDIVRKNPAVPKSHFFQYFVDSYITTQAVGVRRQADSAKEVISMARLLDNISKHPQALSRPRFLSSYEKESVAQWVGGQEWDRVFAGHTKDYVDPGILNADLRELEVASAPIKAFVDQAVAHHDAKPRSISRQRYKIWIKRSICSADC
jgi:hypothetical protein